MTFSNENVWVALPVATEEQRQFTEHVTHNTTQALVNIYYSSETRFRQWLTNSVDSTFVGRRT